MLKVGKEYYAYSVRKPERHYIGYLIALDRQAIIDETYVVKYISVILILFMAPLIVIVFVFFSRKVTKPVGSLIQAAHKIEEGNFGYRIEKQFFADSRLFLKRLRIFLRQKDIIHIYGAPRRPLKNVTANIRRTGTFWLSEKG